MSRRSFLYCDVCNPQATRVIELRRGGRDRDPRMGRRLIDGRAWFDGTDEEAAHHGWIGNADGHHVCPICAASIRKMQPAFRERLNVPDDVLEAILATVPQVDVQAD